VPLKHRDKDALLDEFAQMGSAKAQHEALGDLKHLEKTSAPGEVTEETLRGLESDMAKLKSDALWSKGSDVGANPLRSFHQNADGNGDT
jgi:hypothetical protein